MLNAKSVAVHFFLGEVSQTRPSDQRLLSRSQRIKALFTCRWSSERHFETSMLCTSCSCSRPWLRSPLPKVACNAPRAKSSAVTRYKIGGLTLGQAYDVPNIPVTTGLSPASAANLGLVGSTCTSLTVIGLPTGKTCATSQLPVCCTDNNYVCLLCYSRWTL
ncbi:hypothetical protein JVU11DRAFT_5952 [Chiua virens]|nr:hypothetical protein JVU11DRAFT_5952 [Chiua virens]